MSASLTLLRELDKRHETMVHMANELDWDGLDQEWRAAETDFAALMKMPPLSEIADNERSEVQKLIGNLLTRQKQITERVLPWMEQVRPMLENFDRYPLKSKLV